eukprot:m.77798 g.77798  ORF g.77798 m.77798 type:complete len:190 (+) comp8555_c0_seq3:100-669(+)
METIWRRCLVVLNRCCSMVVAGSAFVVLAYRRDVVAAAVVVGALVDAGAGKLLKRAFAVQRPSTSAKQSHGMPSSHANSLFFWATTLSLALVKTANDLSLSSSSSPILRKGDYHFPMSMFITTTNMGTISIATDLALAAVFTMFAYTVAICYARVYVSKDHTIPQIAAGAILGIFFSLCWYILFLEPIL